MVSGHIEESSVSLPSGTSCWFCTNCLFERNNGESWRDYAGERKSIMLNFHIDLHQPSNDSS